MIELNILLYSTCLKSAVCDFSETKNQRELLNWIESNQNADL